jgi:alkylation response protein AidB-like acyl-CoA dehydrogenase
MNIDQINLSIIKHLRSGRKSYKKIAEKLSISENTVRNRVQHLIDNGISCLNPASMAKYFTVESACSASDEATRIFGGYAYSMEYSVQRYYRDNRFLLYGGGTHEVLQTTIAREILSK